jgi:hypothetical protein
LSQKSQKGSTNYKNKFLVAESGSSFEPLQLKMAQHWADCSKMSTLTQKRLKIFSVAQKGPKKLSLPLIKFLLARKHQKHKSLKQSSHFLFCVDKMLLQNLPCNAIV